jgi:tRNA A-37 threonylcarbamoyl transferase component Bud32
MAKEFTLPASGAPAGEAHGYTWWQTVEGDWVEPPNERRGGKSGVVRVQQPEGMYYVKRQLNHLRRSLRHPFGGATAEIEWRNLQRLVHLGIPTAPPVFFGVENTPNGPEAVLATRSLDGFVGLDRLDRNAILPERRLWLAQKIGETLGRLHRARLQHNCLYDKHILSRWTEKGPEVALIDLEKMRLRLFPRQAARHDLACFFRHQHFFDDKEQKLLLACHWAAFSGKFLK